jgi:HSP20 family protein
MNTLVKFNSPLINFFPSLFDEFETVPTKSRFERNFLPAADVIENDTDYELNLSLAGFEKSDFKIKVEDNVLVISGERKKSEKKYNVNETHYGKFLRKFTLPQEVKIEEITATYVNGILDIKIPKHKTVVKSKLIEIQ